MKYGHQALTASGWSKKDLALASTLVAGLLLFSFYIRQVEIQHDQIILQAQGSFRNQGLPGF